MLKFARRKFLAALAGVWGMTWTEQTAVFNPDDDERNPGEPKRIHRQTDDITSNFVGQQRSGNTTVDIVVYPEHYQPIGVEMWMDGLQMGAALTAEDARELGEELLVAVEQAE